MRWLVLSLAFFVGCSHDNPVFPIVLDPAPFQAEADGRIGTRTGLDTVAVGEPVALVWHPAGATSFVWALTPPPGSLAVLSSATAAGPTFTPDVEGVYGVAATVVLADGSSATAARTITAATYIGLAACATCHTVFAPPVLESAHATTVARDGADLFAMPGCTDCHVLNPVPLPGAPVTGSFDDEVARTGFDPAAFVDFDTLIEDFPTVADRAAVQCESCHGPGSRHDGDPRRIAVSLRSSVCTDCHEGTVGPNRALQQQRSPHGREPIPGTVAQASCQRCHTAAGFVSSVKGEPTPALAAGVPGVSCAACHDSHSRNPAQVRVFGSVPLTSGGTREAGRAGSCFLCHQSDVEDAAAHAAANNPFPCAVQADMIASRGAVEFGQSFSASFHATTVFRLRTVTGDPEDSDTPDACVICHMVPGPGAQEDTLGGHVMRLRDSPTTVLATGNCDRCHPGLDTFDFKIGQDFDGDGVRDGVQTEVQRLSEVLYQAISAADVSNGVSRPGGGLTQAVIAPDPALTTPLLRRAVFNYNFVVLDGSFGVHNTTYSVQLLQRTYEQVTGVAYGTAFPGADVR